MHSASATVWESRPVRILQPLAIIAVLFLIGHLARQEDVSWLPLAIAGLAVIPFVAFRWPYGAVSVLIGMSAMPRFVIPLFGWNARPEHFAAALVFAAASVWYVSHKQKMTFEIFDYFVLAYILINYVSSVIASPSPSQTLRWALLNNLAVLPYFLIRVLVRDFETLHKVVRILLIVGIVESTYGILCLVSHHIFGTTFGVELGQYLGDVAAPYGSLYEPNFFGDYAACCAAFFIALYLAGDRRFRYLVGFLIASLAALLSFSRAALLALVVATLWVFWKAGGRAAARYGKLALSTSVLGLVLIVSATAIGGVAKQRFSNLFEHGLTEHNTITRLVVDEAALQDVPSHPIIGNGTASFNLTFDWAKYIPEWRGEESWIGNAPLRILHDTGILGLTIIVLFALAVWKRIRRALRDSPEAPVLLALGAGTLVYCVSFQSSDATTLAFSWVQIGLLASAAALLRSQVLGERNAHSSRPAKQR